MAYTTTDSNYRLRITIDYEDEAGYQWQRTDTSQPKRMDGETLIGGSADSVGIAARNSGRDGHSRERDSPGPDEEEREQMTVSSFLSCKKQPGSRP